MYCSKFALLDTEKAYYLYNFKSNLDKANFQKKQNIKIKKIIII